ncbi:MAG TPA: Lrp/AsnC family transcriptional regulator [Candidatus Norongarragalinales archaeon]|nr:Lrp/AsnC family transcriptional regulator [Candidatus Norongarragalinales archaeon]
MNKLQEKVENRGSKINKVELDELDSEIIRELRENCKQTWRELAKKLKVSPVTIMNRAKALEGAGVITGYSANINFMKIGFDFSAYQTLQIDGEKFYGVLDALAKMPETEAVYAVSGDFDCILFFRTTDRWNFSRIVQKIRTLDGVKSSKTFFAYEVWKTGGKRRRTDGFKEPEKTKA